MILKKFFKQYWAVIWIVTASVAIFSLYAYAAYTKTNKAKSVVARYGTVETRFSSNYLLHDMNDTAVYISESDERYGDTVKISNFSRSNPAVYYESVIDYKLNMKLGYYSGDDFIYLTDSEEDKALIGTRYITANISGKNYSETVVFGYNAPAVEGASAAYVLTKDIEKDLSDNYIMFLPTNGSNTDNIELIFSQNQRDDLFAETPTFAEKLYLEIIATPDEDDYKDLYPLKARICLSVTGQVESVIWKGNFNELGADTDGAVTQNLDGYNYVIQGVGSGNMKLSWNSNYLEINERFITDDLHMSVPSADANGIKTIIFTVNSNDVLDEHNEITARGVSRYDLQFYCTGTQSDDKYDTWAKINSYVTCDFPYTE